jgi:hypothetical protein
MVSSQESTQSPKLNTTLNARIVRQAITVATAVCAVLRTSSSESRMVEPMASSDRCSLTRIPYGANIRTSRMILLSGNNTDNLFVQ